MLLKRMWALAVVGGLAVLLGFLGRFHWAAELFVHFQVQYLAGFLVLAVGFACMKRWWGMVLCLLLMISPLCHVATTFRAPAGRSAEHPLRVVSFNVLVSNTEYDAVREWLLETDADLVFCCESDHSWSPLFESLKEHYPHQVGSGAHGSCSYALLSKYPLRDEQVFFFEGQPLLKVVAELESGPITVFGVHPAPPVSSRYARMNRGYLEMLHREAKAVEGPALALGDFNCTRWGRDMRPLLEIGYLDTMTGFGYQATWMRHLPIFAIPIDHVLAHEMPLVRKRWIGPRLGSDHSPVVVDFGSSP